MQQAPECRAECEGEGFSSEMSGADCTDEQVTFATFSVGT